jgi:glycosyltransferase involved in cell wall biosynthesis
MTKLAVDISVVIPSYNEATYIDRLLEALAKQNFRNFEVIVSDAQSKDGTAEVVKSFKDGAFGFSEKTYYYMDLRRARAEGIKFAIKGFANEVYRHTHGYNMERNPIKYEFGKHKTRGED